MTPFFSVVIPLYNKEHFIGKTLTSVLNQTYKNFEIIIINDGSTDNSLQQVEAIQNEQIQIYTIKNQGVSYARNFGISKAKADYIVFLDADDFWEINHLEVLKKLRDNFPKCGLYATAYKKRIGNTDLYSNFKNIPSTKDWSGIVEDYFSSSLVNSIAWTSAVMVPKNILEDLKGFDEQITLGAGEDTDLWIRIALNHSVAFSNTITAIHNLHAENRISNSNTNSRKFIHLDKYEKLAIKNHSFKKYLDRNRFSIAIQYKLVGNGEKAKYYANAIQKENLNKKQRFLLGCNSTILKIFIGLQKRLRKFHIHLSAFK